MLNGKHDGQIISGPINKREQGYIYQLLIDNLTADQQVLDYRVPVFKKTIPYLTLRYKRIEDRFDHTLRAVLADPAEVFSAEEQKKILLFCRKMGLDYGELDILRNRADERIYIVDANNTPTSPPQSVAIARAERKIMLEKAVQAFQECFLLNAGEHMNEYQGLKMGAR